MGQREREGKMARGPSFVDGWPPEKEGAPPPPGGCGVLPHLPISLGVRVRLNPNTQYHRGEGFPLSKLLSGNPYRVAPFNPLPSFFC
jgi:hypothetical protein